MEDASSVKRENFTFELYQGLKDMSNVSIMTVSVEIDDSAHRFLPLSPLPLQAVNALLFPPSTILWMLPLNVIFLI